jgi:hypothetical protein
MKIDPRSILPAPPQDCRDPELFLLLNEFEFVRWYSLFDGGPDFVERKQELQKLLWSDAIVARAKVALDDPSPNLRIYAGTLLVWVLRNEAAPFVLTLLGDQHFGVRGDIAELLFLLRDARFEEPLMNLARNDPSPYVRGRAAYGLGGQDAVVVIPTMIEILDNDHEVDESGQSSPSSQAARALDEMLKSEWTQLRHPDGLRSLRPGGVDIASLREQAIAYHRQLRQNT